MNRYLLKQALTDTYNNYKLTVFETSDKIRFMLALRDLIGLSAKERLSVSNNLPFTYEGLVLPPEDLKNILGPICKYTYEQIASADPNAPPWETPKYIAAKNWYNSLSEDDRDKIDTLVKANIPWG